VPKNSFIQQTWSEYLKAFNKLIPAKLQKNLLTPKKLSIIIIAITFEIFLLSLIYWAYSK